MTALADRRVLITRAADDAQRWARRLAARGAVPVILPCVRSESLNDEATRERLRTAAQTADWLLFTSQRGVEAAVRAGVRLAPGAHVAAVGELTASAARQLLGCTPFVAFGATSRALGLELLALWGDAAGLRRVVVIGAEGGRDDAEQVLALAEAHVTRVNVYRTISASAITPRRDLEQERIDDVLLASPSAVTGLLNQARVGDTARLFTIGPTTSAAALAAGLMVTGESAAPGLEGLMEAMQCAIGA